MPAQSTEQPAAGDGGSGDDAPLPVGFTEDALALEFTSRHAQDWRYVAVWGQWLAWTGTRWEREATLRAYDLARLVCRDAAGRCTNAKIKARISAASTVAAVERLARSDRRHAATSEIWDRDPWLLNTAGGIVDLRSAAIRPT